MNILITENNMQKLLAGIISQYKEDIKNNKIELSSKQIDSLFNIVTSGDGNKILSNNGEYKDLNFEELNLYLDKYNNIDSIMTITKKDDNNYEIAFNNYNDLFKNLNIIDTSGDGTKVLNDQGKYVSLPSYGTALTDEEVDAIINLVVEWYHGYASIRR